MKILNYKSTALMSKYVFYFEKHQFTLLYGVGRLLIIFKTYKQ